LYAKRIIVQDLDFGFSRSKEGTKMAEDKKKPLAGTLPITGTGAGEDLEDQPILPEMGGGVDLEEGGEAGQVPDTGPLDLTKFPELHDVAVKKGYKTAADIVEDLKRLEQQNTKLSQELRVANLRATLPPPRPVGSPQAPFQPPVSVEDPYELVQDKVKFNAFMQTTRKQIKDEVKQEIRQEETDKEYNKAYNKAQALIAKDPEKFERLRPIMHQMSLAEPNADLDDLYARAEVKRQADIDELRKEVLGDIDPDRLKVLAAKARPASISGASGGGQHTGGTGGKTPEQIIKEAILGSDKLIE
jgi:hypothetical protein